MEYDEVSALKQDYSHVRYILIVEDDPEIGAFLVETLTQSTPHRVFLVSDGSTTLKILRHLIPDLFLIDQHLSGMSGLELIERLRLKKGFEAIPMLLLSFDSSPEELGNQKIVCIQNPFDRNKLLHIIKQILV